MDRVAGSAMNMFDFQGPENRKHLLLDPLTGAIVKKW
jgi:hypothetical protein